MNQPFHRNAIRHNLRTTTLPGNSRDTGMTAIYAVGCLAVVIVMLVGFVEWCGT